jgi:phytoene synthase
MNTTTALNGKAIQKKYGASYYLATLLFPRDVKEATFSLYGFVRIVDELVDAEPDVVIAKRNIDASIDAWKQAVAIGSAQNEIVANMLHTVKKYKIPLSLIDAFYASMSMDTHIASYTKYADLEKYMYGSAAVIGEMMSHIIGYRGDALPYARRLGEAMQMVNFIRDIDEDLQTRNRIYMPESDMQRFGVTKAMLAQNAMNDAVRNLIHFECTRTANLFAGAKPGIAMLSKHGQKAVIAATLIYQKTLRNIVRANGNLRARTKPYKLTKILILLFVIIAPRKVLFAIL